MRKKAKNDNNGLVLERPTSKTKSTIDPLVGTKWENQYNSLLTIVSVSSTGLIIGEYSSTTGSSGTYPVIGFVSPVSATEKNRTIGITINWKSLDEGTADPSWDWVSAMNGLLYEDGSKIQFLHGMTSSSPFSAVQVYEPGVYTESLEFVPYKGNNSKEELSKEDNDINGLNHRVPSFVSEDLPGYQNNNSLSIFKSISNIQINSNNNNELTASVEVQLSVNGSIRTIAMPVDGFGQPVVKETGLRAITFIGQYTNENFPENYQVVNVSFTGFIDTNNDDLLTLETFKASARTNDNKYTSVSISQDTFSKKQ
ncbi:avidin/streptavidin family protein [Tenacibaculum xiamenense]|uniref:avidin/streptavidin family protein n=1 Tax=Tenacibaculum xiamenense TaxID=1261553 RepID=UPI0038967710